MIDAALTTSCNAVLASVGYRRLMPTTPAEPRVATRHKVFLPAEMAGAGGSARVHLLNLSPSGALIHGEEPPPPGATVKLRCAAMLWSVRVVWAQGKRFGVTHAGGLAPAQIELLLAAQRR
ncbi:PilZ domain-containing protein [Sphingomonas bacterium]|uniref:PilZ domain-containing protein n=1 Tax=Sphingomonas bacterium TaxID=1895847 RepID=UPI001575E05E|nr:PilZ domain-containing protein [Sphingomonas bacterium]